MKIEWKKNCDGVSGAVTAAMIILIVISFISMITYTYVPVWGKEGEMTHMNEVMESFHKIRENIDTLISSGEGKLSADIRLGIEGSPVIGLSRSYGDVTFNPFNGTYKVVNADNSSDIYVWGRGSIVYESRNLYYLQQTYAYENGAIIMKQGKGCVIKAPPRFQVVKNESGAISVYYSIIFLTGNFSRLSGSKVVTIEVELETVDYTKFEGLDWSVGKNVTINITSDYSATWGEYFDDKLNQTENIVKGVDYTITNNPNSIDVTIYNVKKVVLLLAVVEVDMR